jgi:hypothetical protein
VKIHKREARVCVATGILLLHGISITLSVHFVSLHHTLHLCIILPTSAPPLYTIPSAHLCFTLTSAHLCFTLTSAHLCFTLTLHQPSAPAPCVCLPHLTHLQAQPNPPSGSASRGMGRCR